MMKNMVAFILFSCLLNVANAQKQRVSDTIYVKCPQERQQSKYHFVSSNKRSFYTVFSFKTEWQMFGRKKETIEFIFDSESISYKPGSDFFVKMIDTSAIKSLKKVYELVQFAAELDKQKFRLLIANDKIKVVILYGADCLSKAEVYPVKVSTNLTNEG